MLITICPAQKITDILEISGPVNKKGFIFCAGTSDEEKVSIKVEIGITVIVFVFLILYPGISKIPANKSIDVIGPGHISSSSALSSGRIGSSTCIGIPVAISYQRTGVRNSNQTTSSNCSGNLTCTVTILDNWAMRVITVIPNQSTYIAITGNRTSAIAVMD